MSEQEKTEVIKRALGLKQVLVPVEGQVLDGAFNIGWAMDLQTLQALAEQAIVEPVTALRCYRFNGPERKSGVQIRSTGGKKGRITEAWNTQFRPGKAIAIIVPVGREKE